MRKFWGGEMAAAKEIEGLDCGARSLESIGLVLRTRFGEMYELRDAVLGDDDAKGVHDMRVASRRLRSALRDFQGFYERKGLPRRRLREVAGALGEVRDQDVAIGALEEMRADASGAVAEGLEELISERRELRRRARARLTPVIMGEPLTQLQMKFSAWLERLGDDGRDKQGTHITLTPAHGMTFRQSGVEVIEARMEELLEFGDSLNRPFDFEPLHEARISAKRLRYALELFSPCWGGTLKAAAHEVSELQTALGDLRDCDTWIADLGPRLDRQRDKSGDTDAPPVNPRVRPAVVWLLTHFTKERGEHYSKALALWEKWEADAFFVRVREALRDVRPFEPEESARVL